MIRAKDSPAPGPLGGGWNKLIDGRLPDDHHLLRVQW